VDNYASQIQQAPFVILFGPSGTVKDSQSLFGRIIFYVPLKPREVSVARNRGYNEKIRPEIQIPHVHYYHVRAPVIVEEFPKLNCFALQSFTFPIGNSAIL
jgi:hypothetical protein